jgi:site-specific DNA-methyltransferase (adenine-specific)
VTWDLRHGDWREVLADVECDALITDPPYSERTHTGHKVGCFDAHGTCDRKPLEYDAWQGNDVTDFVAFFAPRTRGWFCAMTSHDLVPAWADALERLGRYVFAPLPCVHVGSRVRLSGDGPSCWSVWLVVARPSNREYQHWGTTPGAYVIRGKVDKSPIPGGKTLRLMSGVIRDYTRPGDLVCDPCAGAGTTLLAAEMLGRNSVGAEIDADTHAMAVKRLTGAREQTELAL